MSLEKTTSISVATIKNGKFCFDRRVGEEMAITLVDAEGVTIDATALTADELRALVKEIFPKPRQPRGPRKPKVEGASAPTNGKRGKHVSA